jgi:intracellular sulfur oxidation DsrE/DsrF family protein
MDRFLTLTKIIALLSLAGLLITAAVVIHQLPAIVHTELTAARADVVATVDRHAGRLEGELTATRNDAKQELSQTRLEVLNLADAHLSVIRREAIGELAALRQTADVQLATANRSLSNTSDAFTRLSDAYAVIPATVGARLDPWTECKGNGACWQAQTTATLGALRVTLGETARASRQVRDGVPVIVGNFNRMSESSATIAGNFAKASKPLPWWAQLSLRVLPPVSQAALPWVVAFR